MRSTLARQIVADGRLDAELARRQRERALDEERLRLEGSLIAFVEAAWPSIDSSEYESNWAIDALAEHLQAIVEGKIRKLLINFPPRCAKTTLASICFPAWVWSRRERDYLSGPGVRFLCASYGHALSIQNSNMTRRLIYSDWYRRLWGSRFKLTSDQNSKSRFDTDAGGSRIATSVGGTLLGIGGDIIVCDDPHNIATVESEAELETTLSWWSELSTTRLNDPRRAALIVVMQRLDARDVTGHILDSGADGWDHVCIPMQYVSSRHSYTSIGWHDVRGCDDSGDPLVEIDPNGVPLPRNDEAEAILAAREGELMWPQRFDAKAVASLKAGLGPYRASGRLQQSPSPKGGNLFDRSWWQLWDTPDGKFPICDYVVASLDGAFTENEENDPSALTVWGTFIDEHKRRRIILLDAWRKWVRFSAPKVPRLMEPTVIDGVKWPADFVGPGMSPDLIKQRNANYNMRSRHEWGLVEWTGQSCQRFKVNTLLIEGAASGIAAAHELANRHRGEGWGIQVIPAKGDKIARALAAQPVFSQGLVFAPDRSWADTLISEMAEFPKSKHDDLTDSATQAINHLRAYGLAPSDDEAAADQVAAATPRRQMRAVYPV